jgi:transposase
MPASIPVAIRRAILRGVQNGHGVAELAARFGVAARTVRHLIRHLQDAADVIPAYHRCGRPPATPTPIIEEALALRQVHPTWGGGLIRVLLQEEHRKQTIPCTRTLQRWLRRLGEQPAPAGRWPARDSQRARQAHECWQMDAADQKRLQSGSLVSWLRVADECSGAVLKTAVFPPGELESSPRSRNPAFFAGIVRPLGYAATPARRQRRAVGFVE